ncbi:hypothetical protein [Curtobacterium sp. Curtsp57]|jgi:hypothetical protein|uniref:hypothetical protein n=1 Tax=Curtobacterium sp. Curtsp57 TaxID=3243047 RepID=UPI0039B6ACCA
MRVTRILAITMGVALMTGCAANTSTVAQSPKQRVADAKARTQRFELRVAELVPDTVIDEIRQLPNGSLQSCEQGDMWAGGVTINLRTDAQPDLVLGELGQRAGDAGLEVEHSKSFNGTERITVSDHEGVSVLLDSAPHSIDGGSFSDCFSLPKEFYRGGEF